MVGQSYVSLITPLILVTLKSLVEIVSQLDAGKDANETLDLSNYAFPYGTIPTAPSVLVYASNYDATQEVIALVVIIISLLATVFSMILSQRYQPKESVQTINAHTTNNHDDLSEETDALLSDDGPMQESSVEIEDLISPTSGTRSCGGTGLIRRYEVPPAEEALSPTNVLNTNSDENSNHQL